MHKRSIVIFVDWFHPAFKAGGPIQSCLNVALVLSENYNVYVLSSNTDLDGYILPVVPDKWVSFREGIKVMYVSKKCISVVTINSLFKSINPDVCYFNNIFSIPYTLIPLLFLKFKVSSPRLVIATRGMVHKGALRIRRTKKLTYFRLLKSLTVFEGMHFHATDIQEKLDIKKVLGVKDEFVSVIPNIPVGVVNDADPILKTKGELKLVYISRVSSKKNLAQFIAFLKSVNDSVVLSVYGIIEESYWNQCLLEIATLPPNVKVSYKGSIPHSVVRSVLKDHHFFVLPTLGENFGHAIFESFAAGRPVLISDQTPWRNLRAKKAGWDLSLSDDEGWLNVIRYMLLMGQDEFEEFCSGSMALANSFWNKSNYLEQYSKLFTG